jgi:hypothetical protein
MAIGGDDPLKIQQRAGHRTFEMTRYIRTAEAVGEVIGATFPPLPESLAAGRHRQPIVRATCDSSKQLWTRLRPIRTVAEVELELAVFRCSSSSI